METSAPLPLLSVTLAHEYFSGDFTEFTIAPLPATAIACRRLGLRLLRNGSTLSLTVMANTMQQIATGGYRSALANATLCWEITPTDPAFSAFTGIDFAGSSQSLIFTSHATDVKGGLLTAAARASATDLWARQGLCFDLLPARALRPGSIVSLETAAKELLGEIVVTDPSLVSIDVTQFGSGLYRATQGSSELANWFADERVPSKPTTGAVLVLSSELLTTAFSNALGNMFADHAVPIYTATYPSRPVIWRYHIFNAQATDSLSIVAASNETPLSSDETGTTSKARKSTRRAAAAVFVAVTDPSVPAAKSFEAVRPFKLAEETTQRFALNNGSATLYSPLPVAGFSFARSIRSAAVCSDIFVYL